MVSGKDLIERGWPQGRTIGLALAAAERLRSAGMDDETIIRELEKVRAAPTSAPDEVLEPLELASIRDAEATALEDALRDEALPYGVWGADLIKRARPPRWRARCGSRSPSAASSPPGARSSPGRSGWI